MKAFNVEAAVATVLIVDDDAVARLMAREALEQSGITVIEAENGIEAVQRCSDDHPDIVLLDVQMPELDGFEACARMRNTPAGRDVPILMMTGLDDIDSINRAYEVGATDFVTKPINYLILAYRVRYMLRAKRVEQQVHQLSHYDTVTGLPNRAHMHRQLTRAVDLARRHERIVAVLSLDLDHFQRINDTLGHGRGNELLVVVADRLSNCLRRSDYVTRESDQHISLDSVARLGGDEFLMMLTETNSAEDAALVARRVSRGLRKPIKLDGEDICLTVSIGISVFPMDGADPEALLKQTDFALNHAKNEGRDCYQFYTASMNARAFERLSMENKLRKALQEDQFLLFYQPKIRQADMSCTGCEALIRWRHPELGMVSPAQFIPIAEETNLIVPLGAWVFREACRQLKTWQSAGLDDLSIAVNLSPVQFRQRDLPDILASIIKEFSIPAHLLEIELTESVLMENIDSTVDVLQRLKAIGLNIAIDDFGTGYSSLSYLKRLPIDALKIDQSFVGDLGSDSDNAAIVTAVIAMAKGLRLKVTAEGVENDTQLRFLANRECDELQGYYFSRPVPAAEFVEWLLGYAKAPIKAAG